MDLSLTGLRVLRSVAELGSFTAAADQLGYTQSAVSRQVAALEAAVGVRLLERGREGARLTPAGTTVLRHARVVLDELDAVRRELTGSAPVPVRLGVFTSAGFTVLPTLLAGLRTMRPDLVLTTRDGTTPSLVRSVRAGTLDLAVVTVRPPYRSLDDDEPALRITVLAETGLVVAVPANGRFAGRAEVSADELADVDWVASPGSSAEPTLGVWPGLPGRPRVAHTARDWWTKLRLVAAGYGVTTVTPDLAGALPAGVHLVRVTGVPEERRRVVVVRRPGRAPAGVVAVTEALQETWPG